MFGCTVRVFHSAEQHLAILRTHWAWSSAMVGILRCFICFAVLFPRATSQGSQPARRIFWDDPPWWSRCSQTKWPACQARLAVASFVSFPFRGIEPSGTLRCFICWHLRFCFPEQRPRDPNQRAGYFGMIHRGGPDAGTK